MFPDFDTIRRVREMQTREWLREVERDRLARLALVGHEPRTRPLCRLLAGLGRGMVVWGNRLQERYGLAVDVSRTLESNPQPGGR